MKTLAKTVTTAMFAMGLMAAAGVAQAETQVKDPQKAAAETKKVRSVNYTCDQGKKVKVRYGFDKQGNPTYAEFKSDGKKRFMPLNLKHSNAASTTFGDENSFNMGLSKPISAKSYKSANALILDPASQIQYKNCKAR
ncbi:MAG: adhesin [Acinetobacter sp.]|nr:adhesin [Acinetobacter sp.]